MYCTVHVYNIPVWIISVGSWQFYQVIKYSTLQVKCTHYVEQIGPSNFNNNYYQ